MIYSRSSWSLGAAVSLVLATVLAVTGDVRPTARPDTTVQDAPQESAREAFVSLPLSFERNVGQTDAQVDFLARGSGYTLFLTPSEAVLSLRQATTAMDRGAALSNGIGLRWELESLSKGPTQDALSPPDPGPGAVLRMQLTGANPQAAAVGQDALPARVNYFLGNDPAAWRTDVPTYARVHYQDVYPGVDVVYYGAQRQLEYDFLVAPGADPAAIALRFEGADALEVDAAGDLLLHTAGGPVRQRKPVIYQDMDGVRHTVAGGYALTGARQVSFALGAYDPVRPLVIDPVLVYSTYLGGAGNDSGYGIAVDGSGNVYVTGYTRSVDFPTTAGAYDKTYGGNGGHDAFVAKLSPTPSGAGSLVCATYLGGTYDDVGSGIAVDGSGNIHVTGRTRSADFPTTVGAYDTILGGASPYDDDAFVARINPALSGAAQLVYSSYLGGAGWDEGQAIAVDGSGNAYVTGSSESADFPTTAGAYDRTFSGVGNAFVAKLSPALSGAASLVYSTYLGGTGGDLGDAGQGIAVDGSGNAYVTGVTKSADFPTTAGAYATTFGGKWDVFVAKLNPALSGAASLVYSTYLGGTGQDIGFGIAVDGSGNAYVTGRTTSANFPTTAGAYDTTVRGWDAFVAKLNPSLSGAVSLVYSTYLGGGDVDGYGIAVDGSGNVHVTGRTSSNFPTTAGAYDTTYGGGYYDGFVAKLNPALSGAAQLVYSTYLGGSDQDLGWDIAVDGTGKVYVTGVTLSADFPSTAGAYDATFGGGLDAFVVKLDLSGHSVAGTVTLQFRTSQSAATVTAECTGFAATAPVTDIGAFQITNVPDGTCSLTASAPGYLSARRPAVQMNGAYLTIPSVMLLAGDINGDGVVNIHDITGIAESFGKALANCKDAQNRYVDLDCTGFVNIHDITGAASNFGKTAPQAWGQIVINLLPEAGQTQSGTATLTAMGARRRW